MEFPTRPASRVKASKCVVLLAELGRDSLDLVKSAECVPDDESIHKRGKDPNDEQESVHFFNFK